MGLMLKSDKNFRLSKTTKRMMCSIVSDSERNEFKRMMIQAELAERDAKNKPWSMNKKDREDVSERT